MYRDGKGRHPDGNALAEGLGVEYLEMIRVYIIGKRQFDQVVFGFTIFPCSCR